MQYMLLIYEDETIYGDDPANEALQAIIQAHAAFTGELAAAGVLRGGAGLEPTSVSTTLRKQGRERTVIDGPFAETKEQLGGYYLIEVDDVDAALAWARRLPLHADGSVEIRPVIDMDEPAGEALPA